MKHVFKKALYSILTLFIISIIVFTLFEIMPGSPIMTKLSIERLNDAELVESLNEKYNYDKSPVYRYMDWVKALLSGEDIESILYEGKTVNSLISSRIALTLKLTFYSMFFALLIGIPISVYVSISTIPVIKNFVKNSSILFISIPSFLLGIIFITIFCNWLGIFTITGGSLVLPILTLTLPAIGLIIRYLLPRMQAEVKEDYVTLLKSKGLSDRRIILTHVVKNSLIPVIAITSVIFTSILTGTLIVENIFVLNGTGRLMVNAINGSDYFLIEGIVLCYSSIIILFSIFSDFLYYKVDKRIFK